MAKKLLLVTYAVSDEIEELELIKFSNEEQDKWYISLSPLKRFIDKISGRDFKDKECVFVETGIGKMRSHSILRDILRIARETLGMDTEITVLNIGTAASVNANVGEVVECHRFMDRDILEIGYGDPDEYTIYSKDYPKYLSNIGDGPDWCSESYLGYQLYSCNSGDSFVTDPEKAHQMIDGWTAVCDMEAYAQASAVADSVSLFRTPVKFMCVKYITDKIGEDNTVEGWEEELPAARLSLTEYAKSVIKDFYRN